jgi:hypothetical protein
LGVAVDDTYLGYLTKMTLSNLIEISTGPHSDKMAVEYSSEIESYSDKIISSNYKRLEIESY